MSTRVKHQDTLSRANKYLRKSRNLLYWHLIISHSTITGGSYFLLMQELLFDTLPKFIWPPSELGSIIILELSVNVS